MNVAVRALVLFAAVLIFAGCDDRTAVGGGFELVHGSDMVDRHPGIALAYKGKEVWRNIDLHTFLKISNDAQLYHDGIFVCLISIPDDDEYHLRYEISPQLCAFRGSGPPLVLSERILGHVIEGSDDGVVCKFVPSPAGVHVEFAPMADGNMPATSIHDITWQQISIWLDTPETTAPKIVKPLGTYRVLPPLGTTAAATQRGS